MPKRSQVFIKGCYYHIYQRGVNRTSVFFEEANYEYFLKLMQDKMANYLDCLAFVLMPNHFHFMVEALSEDVSECMRRLLISYTKAINKKYNRTGPLFDTQFKAKRIEEENYLVHLSKYIHTNPVKAGLVAKPEDWHFGSYLDYLNFPQCRFSNPAMVLNQFSSVEHEPGGLQYQQYVENE